MSRTERRDELFLAASELPASERRRFVEEACGEDLDLLEDVWSLLQADSGSETFLRGAVSDGARSVLSSTTGGVVGQRLGPYVLEGVLGSGGMGTVFLARRDDDAFEKRVAIKVIRWGGDTPEMRRRFLVERQILARLEHPFIARLMDGGTTDDRSPYVVMEHVEGDPIDAWADHQRLGIEARLRLFVQVCEAVQYAHANLVVHRDIKPSNVLITEEGTPRLIDFGVAKLLDDPLFAGVTRTGMRMLTPEYASPEQLRGEPAAVASDVYSLGVLLYELLTGRWPYPGTTDDARARERAVLEREPEPPSTALVRGDDATPRLAAARGSDPDRLARRLRGDLDTIVLTALRKEPERRYGSVQQLAEDVRRHLDHLPVSARPETLRYRAAKFVRRNGWGVAAAALTALSLMGGAISAWTGLVRATAAQAEAEASAARADTINAFLTDMLSAVQPDRAQGSVVTVREVLDTAAARLEREVALTGETEVAASLLFTIGESYLALGELDAALPVFERSLAIRGALYGALDDRVLLTHSRIGDVYWQRGDLEASLRSSERILEIRRETVGTLHADYSAALLNLGNTWADLGRYDLAEPLVREAVAVDRQVLEGDDVELLYYTLNSLGTILVNRGRYEEALPLHEESLELRRRFQGDTSTAVVTGLTNLSVALSGAGRPEDAEAAARGALGRAAAILPPDHPRRGHAEVNLARILHRAGRDAEAEPHLRAALDTYRGQLGAQSWRAGLAEGYLGQVLLRLGRTEEALDHLERGWTSFGSALPEGHPQRAEFAREVAALLEETGDPDRARVWRLRTD